ncbi:hypothetical protein V8C86DRAFT_2738830 [Haematococcus lacustris]
MRAWAAWLAPPLPLPASSAACCVAGAAVPLPGLAARPHRIVPGPQQHPGQPRHTAAPQPWPHPPDPGCHLPVQAWTT